MRLRMNKNSSYLWVVFGLSCVIQIVLFLSGVLHGIYNEMDSVAILKGFSPLLLVITGIGSSLLITLVFRFVDLPSVSLVVLDSGLQISSYMVLLIFVELLTEIASMTLILLFVVFMIYIFGGA